MAKIDYHFSFGDSNDGALGMCAVVRADSREEAVQILKDECANMANEYGIRNENTDSDVQYMRVYFNHRNISELDIDDEADIEQEDGEDVDIQVAD